MVLWISMTLFVGGLLLALYGRRRESRFGSFSGAYAENVGGDVVQNVGSGNLTYTAPPPKAMRAAKPAVDKQDRFIKWTGLVIAFCGLVVAALKLYIG